MKASLVAAIAATVSALPLFAQSKPPAPTAMAADADPGFEVAAIKPSAPDARGRGVMIRGGEVMTINTSLTNLISAAFNVNENQILGASSWMQTERFDITGKPDVAGSPNNAQMKAMIRKLLADRFQLKVRSGKKELAVYALALIPNTPPKLTPSDPDHKLPNLGPARPGRMTLRNVTMAGLAGLLQNFVLDRPVVDQTGLNGSFDLTLEWTPDESQYPAIGPLPQPQESDKPDIFTAFREQLGLRLVSTKALSDVLVIDQAEKPSED